MPAAITHYYHSQRVLEEIKPLFPQCQEDAFTWGAQGPDFFFCHRFLPWQRGEKLDMYAESLHDTPPSQTLSVMRDYYWSSGKDPVSLSYIYGFLCHYALDRLAHPFVEYGAARLLELHPDQTGEVFHNQIESALDVIILRYERGELPTDFNLKRTLPKNLPVQQKIAALYSDILERLYGKKIPQSLVLQATKDGRQIFGLLNDRTSLKKNLVEKFEKVRKISCHIRPMSEGDEDYANLLHSEWHWPMDSKEIHDESFFDLFEAAVPQAVHLILNYLDSENLRELTQDIPFC